MAAETDLSTTDYFEAFRLLVDFWAKNRLGSGAA
jgi:hypothetical protein